MFKNVMICIMLTGIVFVTSGCRTVQGLCDDVSTTSGWLADRMDPLAERSNKYDADRGYRKTRVWDARRRGEEEFIISPPRK